MELDKDMTFDFALDISKRRLRCASIMKRQFMPHAYVPMVIDVERIKAKIKELGIEDEFPPLEDLEGMVAMTVMPLYFSDETKARSLKMLGHVMSVIEVPRAIITCDMTVDGGAGVGPVDVLCIGSVDFKEPDSMILVPYKKLDNEDVQFLDSTTQSAVEDDIRKGVAEGFLYAESHKHLMANPDADMDAYVDGLSALYPNVEGKLNRKG